MLKLTAAAFFGYLAFGFVGRVVCSCWLGRFVVWTAFLLDYISYAELRRTIQAATNKSEAFNLFVQWVAFGGGRLLAENTRDEQRE
jgi:TnpA family transposase